MHNLYVDWQRYPCLLHACVKGGIPPLAGMVILAMALVPFRMTHFARPQWPSCPPSENKTLHS